MATKTRKPTAAKSKSPESGRVVRSVASGKLVVKAKDAGPVGRTAVQGGQARADRSDEYRDARGECAEIRELRKKNWIAAHIRERRYELEMTQQDVAEAAGTSHSHISRIEKGDHLPTLQLLQRVLAVLDEEVLIGIASRAGEDPDVDAPELGPVPQLAGAA